MKIETTTFIPDCLKQERKRKKPEPFIKGPIPLDWMQKACKAGGAELALYLSYKHGLLGSKTIHLKPSEVATFGLSNKTRRYQTEKLESAGLVEVIREQSQAPHLTILDAVKSHTSQPETTN